jgi:single-stranded-DNA-specific exonuclease
MLVPEVLIDTELALEDITPKFHRILKQFAPHGPGNMSPIFLTQNLKDTGFGKCVGADDLHLKCRVKQANSPISIDAIGFNLGPKCNLINNSKPFKAAYSVDENEWNGNISLQLKLKDISD